MKKIVSIFIVFFIIGGSNAFAQAEMDAYKYSQSDLHGTARFSSMGGAFGAIGGDISSMTRNPAGLGIYRSSEVVSTLNLSSIKTNTDFSGLKIDQNKTRFNFDNIAYVGYFPTGNYSGIKGWNVGFGYNRVKNFTRNYRMSGTQNSSLSDYAAFLTNRFGYSGNNLLDDKDGTPYRNYNGLSVLAYNAGIIDTDTPNSAGGFFSPFGFFNNENNWEPLPMQNSSLEVIEKGAIDQYDFSVATNINDRIFLGATFVLTDIDYNFRSFYDEDYGFFNDQAQRTDNFTLDNALLTEGNGYAFNIGAIVRPVDFLRVGVAYNSSTWYKLTDIYRGYASAYIYSPNSDEVIDFNTSTPEGATDYELKTPDRWIFSLAGFFGQNALLSVDYELTNYKTTKLRDYDGRDLVNDNISIENHYKSAGTLRVGGEYKVTPQFSVRAGGAWASTPVQSIVKNGQTEIFTAGTITHYTIDKGSNYYTVGFGYRFTPRFYMDIACVYKEQKEDLYAFTRTFETIDGVSSVITDSTPASLKTNTTRVSLTLGYKF